MTIKNVSIVEMPYYDGCLTKITTNHEEALREMVKGFDESENEDYSEQ